MSQTASSEISAREMATRLAGTYLCFELGRATYGLPIGNVRETIGMVPITRVPSAPRFVRGIVNLHGQVIPVISPRRMFELEDLAGDEGIRIVVVRVGVSGGRLTVGILVDRVSDVLTLEASQIEPSPEFGGSADAAFIPGVCAAAGRLVMLLDIERLLKAGGLHLGVPAPAGGEG